MTHLLEAPILPPRVVGEWFPMTFEEFLDWVPENTQGEWVDGKAIIYVSNLMRHTEFVSFLITLFSLYLEEFDGGRIYSQTSILRLPTRPAGRMPDVMAVLARRQDRIQRRWLEGPADLVVELISDDSVRRDLEDKRREYEAEGVSEYVAIDIREGRSGLTYSRLDEQGRYRPVEPDEAGRRHSAVLPGVWLEASWFAQERAPGALASFRMMFPNVN